MRRRISVSEYVYIDKHCEYDVDNYVQVIQVLRTQVLATNKGAHDYKRTRTQEAPVGVNTLKRGKDQARLY